MSGGSGREAVLSALSGCRNFDDVRAAGIIFHGTSCEISGPLRGGGYDGVFWAADSPSVAQAYIPKAGVMAEHSWSDGFRARDRIWPTRNASLAQSWALSTAGKTLDEIVDAWDGHRASSVRFPAGWPTYGDYDDHLEALGYDRSDHRCLVSSRRIGDAYEAAPASWRLPGLLIVALPSWSEAFEPGWGEGAPGEWNHNRIDEFEGMRVSGAPAFRMSDMLQSERMGNVGHEAIGVLPAGLEGMRWMAVPAVRHDGDDLSAFSNPETPEFLALMAEVAPGYDPVREDGPEP